VNLIVSLRSLDVIAARLWGDHWGGNYAWCSGDWQRWWVAAPGQGCLGTHCQWIQPVSVNLLAL